MNQIDERLEVQWEYGTFHSSKKGGDDDKLAPNHIGQS